MSASSHYDNYYESQSSYTMYSNQQTCEDNFVEFHEVIFSSLFWILRHLIIFGGRSDSVNIISLVAPIYIFAVPRAWKRNTFVSTYFPLAVLAFIPNSFFMTSMITEDVSMQNLARMLFCLTVPMYVDMYIVAVIKAKQADPEASLLLGLDWVPGYSQDLLKAAIPEHTYVSQGTQTSAEDLGPDPAAEKASVQQRRYSTLSLLPKPDSAKDLCCMPAGKACHRHRPNGPKSRRIRAELGMELVPESPIEPETPSPIQQHERPAQREPETAEPEVPAEPTTSPVDAPVQERDITPGCKPIDQGQEVQPIVSPTASPITTPTEPPTETPAPELPTSPSRSPEIPAAIIPAAVDFWRKEDRSPPKFDKRQHTRAHKKVACTDPFERSGHIAGWRKADLSQGSGSTVGQWRKDNGMLRAFVKRELAIHRTPLETMMIRSSRCLQRLGVRHARAIGYRADRLVFNIIRASQKGRISRLRKQAQEEEEEDKENMVAAVPPIEDSPAAANVVAHDVEEVLTVDERLLTMSPEAAVRSDIEVATAAAITIPLPRTPSPPATESGDAQLAAPEPAPSAPSAPSEDAEMASIEPPSSDLVQQQLLQQQVEVQMQDEVLSDLTPSVDAGINQQPTLMGPPAAAFVDMDFSMAMAMDDQWSTEQFMDMAMSEYQMPGVLDFGFGPIDQDTAMIEQGLDSLQLEMQSHQQTGFVENDSAPEQYQDFWLHSDEQAPVALSQDLTMEEVGGQGNQMAPMAAPVSQPAPAPAPVPAMAPPSAIVMPIMSWPGQTQAEVVEDSASQQTQRAWVPDSCIDPALTGAANEQADAAQILQMHQQVATPAPNAPGVFNSGQATAPAIRQAGQQEAPAEIQAHSQNDATAGTVGTSQGQQQGGAQLQESSVFTFSQPAPRHLYQSSPMRDTHPVLQNPALTVFARREGHEVVRPPSIFTPETLSSPAERAMQVLSEAAAAAAAPAASEEHEAPQPAQDSPQQQAEASGPPSPPVQEQPAAAPEAGMGEADDSFGSIGEEMNAIHAEWQQEALAKDDVDLTELDRQLLGLISPATEYAGVPPLLSPLNLSSGSKRKSPDSQDSWSSDKARRRGRDNEDDGDDVPLFAAIPPEVLAFQRAAGMLNEQRDAQGGAGPSLPPIQSHHGGDNDVPLFAPMPEDLLALQAATPSKPPRKTKKKQKTSTATASAAPARQQDTGPSATSSSTGAQQTAPANVPVFSSGFTFAPSQGPSIPGLPSLNMTPSGPGAASSSTTAARPRPSQARAGSSATQATPVAGPIFKLDPVLLDRNTEGAFAPIPTQDSVLADLEAARAAVQENLKEHPTDVLGGHRSVSSGSEAEPADEEVMKTRKVKGLTRSGKK